MPLINRIGGGGGSKAPVTGIATYSNATKIKISSEQSLKNYKYIVIYATGDSSNSDSKTIFFVMHSLINDLPLVESGVTSMIQTTNLTFNYGGVRMGNTEDVFSFAYNESDNSIDVTVNTDYEQLNNFNQNLSYAYAVFY